MGAIYQIHYHLARYLARTLFDFRVFHGERLLQEGGMIMAMNHESYLDPPLAGIATSREIYFLARRTLLEWPILGPLFPALNVIPVNQERADMSALKAVIKLVRSGSATIIFPEGSRTLDGELQPAQPGLGLVIPRLLRLWSRCGFLAPIKRFPAAGNPDYFSQSHWWWASRCASRKRIWWGKGARCIRGLARG